MSPTAAPTRTNIDFRPDIHPSRAWILGLGADDTAVRVDLLATPRPTPALAFDALTADCVCPDFCERDHDAD